VSVRRIPARNLAAFLVQDNDRRFEVADINGVVGVDIDIGGPVEVSPLRDVAPFGRKELDAAVLAVANVNRALLVDPEAVRQMEFARPLLARLTPRTD
jgi:hypothetical protein